MDADRFDALSRALTTAPSRRTTLGALLGAVLGSVLPGLSSHTHAAARKRNGRDVGTASHCLPPGAKPCRNGDQCCSGRCKRKKKKCLDCATGTRYCASQEKCVDSAQFDTLCTDGGGTGTCTTDNDCCPDGNPDCHRDSVYGIYRRCAAGGVCSCPSSYPADCTFDGSPVPCHECCNNDDCVVKTGDPNRTCFFGNCGCNSSENPDYCRVFRSNPLRYACTNTKSDPTNCGFCLNVCNEFTETCVNGGCVPKP